MSTKCRVAETSANLQSPGTARWPHLQALKVDAIHFLTWPSGFFFYIKETEILF